MEILDFGHAARRVQRITDKQACPSGFSRREAQDTEICTLTLPLSRDEDISSAVLSARRRHAILLHFTTSRHRYEGRRQGSS